MSYEPPLEERLAKLEKQFESLLSARIKADLDRVIPLREVAGLINKSPETLRRWVKNPDYGSRYAVASLLERDASGDLVSTPRRVERWKQERFSSVYPEADRAAKDH